MKNKAPPCAKSEATVASLPALSSAKLTLGDGTKSLASLSEANATSEVNLTLPVIKRETSKLGFSSLNSLVHDLLESLY